MTGWKELFSHTNPSNFHRPLQSLLLRYTAENLQVTKIEYALLVNANKPFQKRAILVFTEVDDVTNYWKRPIGNLRVQ